VLADNRIVFHYFHLVRGVALVLDGGVEMAGVGAGYEFDFFTHGADSSKNLNLFAAAAQVRYDRVDAQLVDNAYAFGGKAQSHPALFTLYPETVGMEIGQKTAPCLVVGVGYIIPGSGALARHLAYSGHDA
jgi:hypothetical protein